MRILCPLCGFAREMDEARIPARAQMATCPKCAHKFRFRVVDVPEAPEPVTPAAPQPGQDLSAVQPDPMAAQRAAAAEAWKRLQTPPPKADGQSADAPAAPAQPGEDAAPAQAPAGHLNQTETATPWPAPDAPRSTGSPVPFEDLPRHGFFPGLFETIKAVLTAPSAFFRAMPPAGGMGKPLAFHLLLAEFMVLCQYVWSLAGMGATAEYLRSQELMDMGLSAAGAAPLLLLVIYPLLLVLRLLIMTGVIHLLLRLARSGKSGAEATFRVLCYAAAPLVLGVIPGFGPLIGGAWSVFLTILGLKLVHKSRLVPALFAVLLPFLLLLAAVIGYIQGIVSAGL